MANKILIVDLETTGTNPQRVHILEVALASVDLDTGDIQLIVDSLVCPQAEETEWLDCWFMEHSKLNPDLIRLAPDFGSVRQQIQKQLYRYPLTAFNKSYDIQILFRYGLSIPYRAPCLMLTCKDIMCLPGYYGDYKYPKFSEAWSYFFDGEPMPELHRAACDAVAEARLLKILYQKGLWKL